MMSLLPFCQSASQHQECQLKHSHRSVLIPPLSIFWRIFGALKFRFFFFKYLRVPRKDQVFYLLSIGGFDFKQMKRDSFGDSWTNILMPLALILGLFLLLSLNPGQTDENALSGNPLEPWLKLIIGYLASGAEIAAALVIAAGIIRNIAAYASALFSRSERRFDTTESIRLRLGRVLTLGLEFTVASDILRTAVAPTRQDILNLGAIVLLRTLLNHFLELEIRQVEERRQVNREQPNEQVNNEVIH
jgi:uncharacterized membrane protein